MYRLSEGLIRILLSVGPAFRNLMLIQMLKGAAQIVLLFPAVKSQISPTTRQAGSFSRRAADLNRRMLNPTAGNHLRRSVNPQTPQNHMWNSAANVNLCRP
ncbi:hypothetical protein WJX77_001106 [Trebouxia sp. C0004]